jgi:regulator of replication initiation timing
MELTTNVVKVPALAKEMATIEEPCNQLVKENEELKIEPKSLENLLEQLKNKRYEGENNASTRRKNHNVRDPYTCRTGRGSS